MIKIDGKALAEKVRQEAKEKLQSDKYKSIKALSFRTRNLYSVTI